MGLFLSLSGVIGKSQDNVVNCLGEFVSLAGGSIIPQQLSFMNDNCCIIKSTGSNVSVLYPNNFYDWDDASAYLSQRLQAPVFSFHIHDGDMWLYVLYVNGEIEDRFNPIPDYWDDKLPEDELDSWKGNVEVVTKYVPGLHKDAIAKYLVRWDLEDEKPNKAYETDSYSREDWQLVDFMQKLNLVFPLNYDDSFNGDTYAFTTKKTEVNQVASQSKPFTDINETKPLVVKTKPWWKFW